MEIKTTKEEVKIKKTCFIITPIGNDTDPIRRHIDGVIDECIVPVLGEKYEILVSHRMSTPGSITNQIIGEIYKADLVIANLTNLNPNVMYELAFRHAVRKPVIIIMQRDSGKLPFDTITERTIFYTNDFTGAIELKEKIAKTTELIENTSLAETENPIYTALERLQITENIIKNIATQNGKDMDAMQYIINTLQRLENKVSATEINSQIIDKPANVTEKEIYVLDVQDNFDEAIATIRMFIKEFKLQYQVRFIYKQDIMNNDYIRIRLRGIDKDEYKIFYKFLEDELPYRISELPFN